MGHRDEQRAQPAASKEMGLLFRRDVEGPGGAGPVPTLPGVRVQFRKPQ
uniref:Regulator of G protein signaling 6 n=1 Tax=Molossus molossus TaxID=27622 RepID=A0A7J8K130_MOLMO|nr:regulator of G protein signaling 6 [Molossus molossus]